MERRYDRRRDLLAQSHFGTRLASTKRTGPVKIIGSIPNVSLTMSKANHKFGPAANWSELAEDLDDEHRLFSMPFDDVLVYYDGPLDRKRTRLNTSHYYAPRMTYTA